LVQAFKEMSRYYPMGNPILYRGKYLRPQDVPWHYNLVWIAISTPLVQIAGFILGLAVCLRQLVGLFAMGGAGKPPSGGIIGGVISPRNSMVLLAWFCFPLAYLILSRAALFDGWRHTYFVYPGFVGISVAGLVATVRLLRARLRPSASRAAVAALVVVVALGLANIARTMARYHPYEYLYFNALTGGAHGADGKYDLDYWGLSYRQALEYILKIDKAPLISFCAHTRPGIVNADILPAEDRQRLHYIKEATAAKYYLTDLRWDTFPYSPEEIVREIRVDGAKIMMVVRVIP
jgi:hypothetical protein